MRVAVSASGSTLDAQVDPRFGRCPYFVVVDSATMAFESLENSNAGSPQGAGIATAQMIAGKGVEAVLTGNCGPNAYQTLEAAGVKVVVGVSGLVREAVQAYRDGRLQASSQANVASHHGVRGGIARGMGGAGEYPGGAVPPVAPSAPGGSDVAKLLGELQGQMESLRLQLEDIRTRIDELHKNE